MNTRYMEPVIKLLFDIVNQDPHRDEKQSTQKTHEAKEYIKFIIQLEKNRKLAYEELSNTVGKKIPSDPNISLNVYHEDGSTFLIKACEKGHTHIIEALLEAGADPDKPSETFKNYLDISTANRGETPLIFAARFDRSHIVDSLLKAKANSNRANENTGETPLSMSIERNYRGIVKTLLLAKADFNKPNKKTGKTPLTLAIGKTDPDLLIVEALLNAGADPNKLDDNRNSPLGWAAFLNHLSIVNALLSAGAQPNKPQVEGFTPLIFAAEKGHDLIVNTLLESGANPNQTTEDNKTTALLDAVRKGHVLIVNTLLKAGANPDQGNALETPLGRASFDGKASIAEALLNAGADCNKVVVSDNQATALCCAAQKGHVDVVNLLLKAGADFNKTTTEGCTPLMFAIRNNKNLAIAERLLRLGADTEKLDKNGKTALDYEIEAGNINRISFLLEYGAVIRHPEKLETFLNSQPINNEQVQFCWGVLYERKGNYNKAKDCYKRVSSFHPPACRKLGEIEEKEGSLSRSIISYKAALKLGDWFGLNRLVSVAQKLLTKKDSKMVNEYTNLMSDIYSHLILTNMQANLTTEQWIFLAADAMGNSNFKSFDQQNQHPLYGIHFALRASRNAEVQAKTESDKHDAKQYKQSAWRMFWNATNNSAGYQKQLDALTKIEALESTSIIGDYLGDKKLGSQIGNMIFNLPIDVNKPIADQKIQKSPTKDGCSIM